MIGWAALIAGLAQRTGGEAWASSPGAGYGKDPAVMPPEPAPWLKQLTPEEREVVRALVDQILPADEGVPAASEVGLVDFFDEWLSAPYPEQKDDRRLLLPLLSECSRRSIADSGALGRWLVTVCDPKSSLAPAFERMRVLCAAAYYTTAAGIDRIGFVGNVPHDRFDGPPAEVLQRFDAALRVLEE